MARTKSSKANARYTAYTSVLFGLRVEGGDGGALMGLGDADGGHAGCGGGLDADVGVFEDEAVLGVYA